MDNNFVYFVFKQCDKNKFMTQLYMLTALSNFLPFKLSIYKEAR